MWPDYFPEQCPPSQARGEELRVFRLVSQNPPTKEDFLPSIIEQPHRKFDTEEFCCACGVSVFKDIADVKVKMARYKALRKKQIAMCEIKEQDGLILETFSGSHVTWWLRTDTPHSTFREVVENVTG